MIAENSWVARTAAGLANIKRVQILERLAIGPCGNEELMAALDGVPATTLQFHMNRLSSAGLVMSQREGMKVEYWLCHGTVKLLIMSLEQMFGRD